MNDGRRRLQYPHRFFKKSVGIIVFSYCVSGYLFIQSRNSISYFGSPCMSTRATKMYMVVHIARQQIHIPSYIYVRIYTVCLVMLT